MATKRVPIEIDVTQVNKTWFTARKPANEKHYVIGFFQREGNVIIRAIPDNDPETIKSEIIMYVAKGCMVYAEQNVIPESLKEIYEVHELPEGRHVDGDVHVNNVKNAWRDLKRVVKRTHIQVSQKHMQSYCNEVAWRINHAHLSPSERFETALSQCLLVKPGIKSKP